MKTTYTCFCYGLGCIIILFLFGCVCAYTVPLKYRDTITLYCKKFDLNPAIVCAVVNAESKYQSNAISSAGAQGLMQLMPSTAQYLAEELNFELKNLFDIDANIYLGCYYLRKLLNKYNDVQVALCAYNAGPNTVDGWLNNTKYSQNNTTLDTIPYPETSNYLRKVNIYRTLYTKIYNL